MNIPAAELSATNPSSSVSTAVSPVILCGANGMGDAFTSKFLVVRNKASTQPKNLSNFQTTSMEENNFTPSQSPPRRRFERLISLPSTPVAVPALNSYCNHGLLSSYIPGQFSWSDLEREIKHTARWIPVPSMIWITPNLKMERVKCDVKGIRTTFFVPN